MTSIGPCIMRWMVVWLVVYACYVPLAEFGSIHLWITWRDNDLDQHSQMSCRSLTLHVPYF